MNETLLAKLSAAFSVGTLALFGVDHYALIWGFVGALVALFQHRERMGAFRAITFVMLSTLSGAAMATWGITYLDTGTRPVLIGMSLVAGFGAQLLLTALIRNAIHRINQIGGDE